MIRKILRLILASVGCHFLVVIFSPPTPNASSILPRHRRTSGATNPMIVFLVVVFTDCTFRLLVAFRCPMALLSTIIAVTASVRSRCTVLSSMARFQASKAAKGSRGHSLTSDGSPPYPYPFLIHQFNGNFHGALHPGDPHASHRLTYVAYSNIARVTLANGRQG